MGNYGPTDLDDVVNAIQDIPRANIDVEQSGKLIARMIGLAACVVADAILQAGKVEDREAVLEQLDGMNQMISLIDECAD